MIFGLLPVESPGAPTGEPQIRAVRLWRVVLAVMEAAVTSGALIPSRHRLAVEGVLDVRVQPLFGETRRPPFEDAPIRSMALMSGLIGAMRMPAAPATAALADGAGLRLPVGPPDPTGSDQAE